jgi:hypothetical protein
MSNQDQAAGGSGAGRNVPVNNQNVVIDAKAQQAVAQKAQQILANTNITLKKELVGFLGREKQGHRNRHTIYGKN